jgi:hypothetical protein
MAQLLEKVDSIFVSQMDKHQHSCAKWDQQFLELTLAEIQGLPMICYASLVSHRAFDLLSERRVVASRMRVVSADDAISDAIYEKAWSVQDAAFASARVHIVQQVRLDSVANTLDSRRSKEIIVAALTRTRTDLDHCGLCGGAAESVPETGGFPLPPRWKKLYSNRPILIQLCRALGFGEPVDSGTNNSNIGSLIAMIEEYEQQLSTLLQTLDAEAARRGARDYMQGYLFNEEPLGAPGFLKSKQMWMYCGLMEGEDEVPKEFQKHYCGKAFHFECMGLLRVSKKERIACLRCSSDPKYRPKQPEALSLMEKVQYLQDGRPRIVEDTHSNKARIKTLVLECNCLEAVGSGLPCEAMQAVAHVEGGCLSSRLVHPCWFSHKLIGAPDPIAVFESTKLRAFNKDAVLENKVSTAASSALGGDVREPAGAMVIVEGGSQRESDPNVTFLATQSEPGGKPMDKAPTFDAIRVQGRGNDMKSRRHKPKKNV